MKEVICSVNEVIRGWVNYFRIGNSTAPSTKSEMTKKKVRKFVMKRKKPKGFG
jgi:RNA-directed DNA polymerase